MSGVKTRLRIALTSILGKTFTAIPYSFLTDSQIISFDVFDTLILRPSLSVPSDIFALLHPDDSGFKKARIQAEKQAREEGRSRRLEDVKLTDIYKVLIGDNLISDYIMPRRVGIKRFLYKHSQKLESYGKH